MIGHIILHRDIMEWEWYQSSTVFRVYVHLLIKANYKDKRWQGQLIKRGQLISSIGNLASELMLSYQTIRTALSKLNESHDIVLKPTNKFTLITLVNYENYQSAKSYSNKQNNTQVTNHQQSNNKPLTTTKERNKRNKVNKEKIELRREKFKKQVFEHSQYNLKILKGFYNYWSELNSSETKMRCEKDGFFDVEIRLEKWLANEKTSANQTKEKSELLTNR
ncbi:MAG: hypothetical protein AB8B52_02335 [Winogradskyella sp.]|uniref:hypothetical protein n=1 Tax=Winogradskyella sp. TaxID=1883156 RepID=UPI00385F4934